MPPSSCGRRPPQDPYPTTTPPQPSGGASSTSYRKRRTRSLQPPRQSQRPGARPRPHTTSSHRCRARRPLPRSVRAAENVHTSQRWRSVSQDLLPNLSADQGRLLRGGDWHSSGAGYDISVRDGSARRSGQLSGDASDLRKHDVPPRGTPGGGTKAVMPPPHH